MDGLATKVTVETRAPEGNGLIEEFASLDSVEIKRSGKGDISFSVKCYGNNVGEAMKKADLIFEKLHAKHIE